MSTAAIPTWHHPHFVDARSDFLGTRYEFKAFTGLEPEPALPDDVLAAFDAACDGGRNPDAVRARSAAQREVRAANVQWQIARFRRQATQRLREAAPIVRAWLDARAAAVAAYEELRGTPDGWWQSKLLALAEARRTAMVEAENVDRVGADVAFLEHGLSTDVQVEAPPLTRVAAECGVDLGGWAPASFDQYEWAEPPSVRELRRLFAEQDQRIAEATRLFAGDRR